MSTPAIIYVVLSSIGLLLTAYQHGKPKTGKQNVFTTLIALAIIYSLLIWGGFFN